MKIVVVVGVGALGSHVVQFIRNASAVIKVVDFDKVETKNVLAQFHAKTSVGKSKVQSLKGNMALFYGLQLDVVPHKLTKDNVEVLLSKSTLVIDCLDNGASRRVVQSFCKANKIPCLHGALAANGAYGRVVWTENFVVDDEDGGVPTCEDGEHLPFIAMVSSWISMAAIEFLRSGKKVGFEVSSVSVQRII